jgi:hypothetical protein
MPTILTNEQRQAAWAALSEEFRTTVSAAFPNQTSLFDSQFYWRWTLLTPSLQLTATLTGRGYGIQRRATGTVRWQVYSIEDNERCLIDARSWASVARQLPDIQAIYIERERLLAANVESLARCRTLAERLLECSAVSDARPAAHAVAMNVTLTEAQAAALLAELQPQSISGRQA